jgi:hypothetical protein
MSKSIEETALYIARLKPGYDDGERPVRKHATPALPHEIKLAFAVMQEMVDRIAEIEPNYCDAGTATGRCFQAALFVARAHQLQMTGLRAPVTLAAGIVIQQIREFLASRPTRKWERWDEASSLRRLSAMLSLGGMAASNIADKLGLDTSDLRKSVKKDLDEIERRFGHFCKGNKGLRKKWQLPEIAAPICYNSTLESEASAAPAFAVIDPDFDELSEIFSQVLFD